MNPEFRYLEGNPPPRDHRNVRDHVVTAIFFVLAALIFSYGLRSSCESTPNRTQPVVYSGAFSTK